MFKLPYSSTHLTVSKVMLKILQARLHQKFPDVQAGFRKGRGTNIWWIIEKAREFQKNIYFCFTDYVKAFDSVEKKIFFWDWKASDTTEQLNSTDPILTQRIPPWLLPSSRKQIQHYCSLSSKNKGENLNSEKYAMCRKNNVFTFTTHNTLQSTTMLPI